MPTPQDALEALCGAAIRGRWRQVESVLAIEPDLPIQSIHAAALLLDQDALLAHLADDPSRAAAAGPGGLTPLAWVALSEAADGDAGDHGAAARLLLAHGAPPADGARAALEGNRLQVLEAILEAGLSPTDPLEAGATTLLHHACERCWRPDLAACLLARPDVDLEARSGAHGETPLYAAARRGRADAVEQLIQHGADVNSRTGGGDTAYRHAVRRPFPALVELLASCGADTSLKPIDEAARALHGGDLEGARSHLTRSNLGGLAPEEARLLPDLAARNAVEGLALLLDLGLDPDARCHEGGTALMHAAWSGARDAVRLLLQRGAQPNAGGCAHDSSPLGWLAMGSTASEGAAARQDDYADILEQLLAKGAEPALPGDPAGRPGRRVLTDAAPRLASRLREHLDPEEPVGP